MSEDNKSAISDAFSREVHHFVSFLEQIQFNWPGERSFIDEELHQHAHNIYQIVRLFRDEGLVENVHSIRNALGQFQSLPTLPPSPAVAQEDDLPCFHQITDCFTPIGTSLQLRPLDKASESLTARVLRDSSLPDLENEAVSLRAPPQNINEDMTVIVSNRDGDHLDIMSAGNGTIHPARLCVNGAWPHHATENDFAFFNSEITQSSRQTALTRSAAPERTPAGYEIAPSPIASSNQGASRKRKRPNSQSTSQRKRKKQAPEHSAQRGSQLRCEIVQHLGKCDHDQVQNVCDLYLATASADSMYQLKDIITSTRRSEKRDFSSIVNTVYMLDKLDAFQLSAAFLRRVLLLRLADHREGLMEELREHRQSTSNTSQILSGGKLESVVLDTLLVRSYTHIKRPLEEDDIQDWRKTHFVARKALQNRLTTAKNWRHAVERFKLGIVALVPTGGVFQIQNQSFETLREVPFQVLLDFLEKKEDGYVLRAAAQLTPFVQAVYDGKHLPSKFGVELLGDFNSETINPSMVLELCKGVLNTEDCSDLLSGEHFGNL